MAKVDKTNTDQISKDKDFSFQETREIGHNYFMYIEDLSFSKYSRLKEDINFSIKSKHSNILELISDILPVYGSNLWRQKDDLNDLLLDFFVIAVNTLVSEGHFAIEKINDVETKELLYLKPIQGDLKFKRNKIVQILQQNNPSKTIYIKTSIPKIKCFIIEFPKDICSKKEFLRNLKSIKEIDEKNPIMSILYPTKLSGIKGYNSQEHQNKLDLSLRKLTNKTSWHHRDLLGYNDNFSKYYLNFRSLNFKKTKIILTLHILNFIKHVIENIFEETTVEYSLKKNLNDIDKLIKDLELGNLTYDNYLESIR